MSAEKQNEPVSGPAPAEPVTDVPRAEPVTDAPGINEDELDRICPHNLLSAFIRVSRSQADLTGAANPAEMLEKTYFDYFSPDHAETALKNEQRIIRTGVPMFDIHETNALPRAAEQVLAGCAAAVGRRARCGRRRRAGRRTRPGSPSR